MCFVLLNTILKHRCIKQFYSFQVQIIHIPRSFWGSQCTSPIQQKCQTELNATKKTIIQQTPYLQYSPPYVQYMDNTLSTTMRDNQILLTPKNILQMFKIIYVRLKCMVNGLYRVKINVKKILIIFNKCKINIDI